jgi:hypothetical protein
MLFYGKIDSYRFYDVILEMVQNVSIHNRRFKELNPSRQLDFNRLVFVNNGKNLPG